MALEDERVVTRDDPRVVAAHERPDPIERAISSSPSTKRTRRSKFSRTSSTMSGGSTVWPIAPRPAYRPVQKASSSSWTQKRASGNAPRWPEWS